MITRKIRTLATVAALAAGLGVLGAVPALAATAGGGPCPSGDTCSGSVPATLTIGESLTLTINAPGALTFAGAPGSSAVSSVSYNVLSNDGAGYALTAAAANANMTSGAHSFPVSDIALFGPAQVVPCGSFNPWSGQCWAPVPVSTTAVTTMASSTVSAVAGDSGSDNYAFVAPGFVAGGFPNGYTSPSGGIPNEPAGSYSDSVLYLLLAN